jgi:hypothetical protein
MRYARIALTTVLGTAAAFGALTLAALEGGEVVVLRTFGPQAETRQTRTWVADADGSAWIEAANASRPLLAHIRANPEVELFRGGVVRQCHALSVANPDGHEHIRCLLAQKYGWADRWVGLLTDTSGSVAIRLDCR